MTASWPTTVPTTAELRGNIVDNKATLLSASLSAIATTINVDDTTGFPSAGLLSLRKANHTGTIEVVSYTGKTGTSFTGVTRNFNGLGASAYSEDDEANLHYVADHHNRLAEEIIAIAQNISTRFGGGATDITNGQSLNNTQLNISFINAGTGSAAVRLLLSATSSSTGDPFMAFSTSTGFAALGLDRSDSSKFKLAMGDVALGAVNTLAITQAGALTYTGAATFSSTFDVGGASTYGGAARFDANVRINSSVTRVIDGVTAQFEMEGISANTGSMAIINNLAATTGPALLFGKTRSASIAGTTVVVSGDTLGRITFCGSDGTNLVQAAQILGASDGTPGSADMPGRLVFSTTADGASTLTERLRIDSTGLSTFTGWATIFRNTANANLVTLQNSATACAAYIGITGATNTNGLYISSNRDIAGTIVNSASTTAAIYMETSATTSTLLFQTTASVNTAPTTRLTIDKAGLATFTGNIGVDGAAGDASINFYVTSGVNWTMGIDNSVSNDPFCLSRSSALGTTDIFQIFAGTTFVLNNLIVEYSSSGGDVSSWAVNDSNTASSNAYFACQVAGTSAGDPYITFKIVSGSPAAWSMGVDNSDSDKFKINNSTSLAVGSTLEINASNQVLLLDGAVTAPIYTFSNNTNMGMYRSGAGALGFTIPNNGNFLFYHNSVNCMRFDGGALTWWADTTTKTVDFGIALGAFDDMYADDFNNVADIPFFDHVKDLKTGKVQQVDDLAVIRNIKPMTAPNGDILFNENGHAYWDDSTLPDWIWLRDKHDRKKIVTDADGKPWISMKVMAGLALGGLGQLIDVVDEHEKRLKKLEKAA